MMQVCRLCLIKDHVDVNIFENPSKELFHKIVACLPISISEDDKLPKKVCVNCCNKVNLLYEFSNQTLEAQKYLLSWLNSDSNDSEYSCHDSTGNLDSIEECLQQENSNKNTIPKKDADRKISDFLMRNEENGDITSVYTNNENQDTGIEAEKNIRLNAYNADSEHVQKRLKSVEVQSENSSALKQLQGGQKKSNWNESYEFTVATANAENVVEQATEHQSIKLRLKKRSLSKPCDPAPPKAKTNAKWRKKKFKFKGDVDEKNFKCQHCDQVFESVLRCRDHEKSAHATHYKCDKCSYSTYAKGCFVTHLKRHIKQYSLFCEICNSGFFNNTELTSHNIKLHDMQPFQCAICNDLFTSKGNLYSHIKNHDPNNLYVCEICGRTYKKKNSYKRHIARSHLGLTAKAQCHVCQRILSSKEHLRRHMLTHTDERNWVCSTCGKCFLSKTYLTEHSRIHLGIRPYKCEICEKCFTQRGSLTIHKRSHTGERPFKCEYCNKGFVMSTLLRYHLRKCNEAKLSNHNESQSTELLAANALVEYAGNSVISKLEETFPSIRPLECK